MHKELFLVMPLGAIAEGTVRGTIRFFTYILIDIAIDTLIRGPGYLIMKWAFKTSADSDSFRVLIVGMLFWGLIGIGVYSLNHHLGMVGSSTSHRFQQQLKNNIASMSGRGTR